MISQFNRTELAAISTLAASTGVIIMTPDRGLLPVIINVLIIIFIQRFLHRRSMQSAAFEYAVEGHLATIVKEGYMDLEIMKDERISREQLFTALREAQVIHLGEVRRVYLEASGDLTIVKQNDPKPGLPVVPDWDRELLNEFSRSGSRICYNCGAAAGKQGDSCHICNSTKIGTAFTYQ